MSKLQASSGNLGQGGAGGHGFGGSSSSGSRLGQPASVGDLQHDPSFHGGASGSLLTRDQLLGQVSQLKITVGQLKQKLIQAEHERRMQVRLEYRLTPFRTSGCRQVSTVPGMVSSPRFCFSIFSSHQYSTT